jgi:hypothetical protein
MNGHFSAEIGRMRSAEMVSRGVRRQELAGQVEYRSPRVTPSQFAQAMRLLFKGRPPRMV